MSKFRIKIKKQENLASESVGGKRQPCSGALRFAKGDGIGENYLVECKRTDKKSISVKASVLDKITREATHVGRLPLLFLELKTGVWTSKNWVVVELSTFQNLSDNGKK